MKIEAIYTQDPATIGPDAPLDEAIALMDQHGIRHLPVVEDGRLLGIVSNRDLLEMTGWLPARMRQRYAAPDDGRAKVRDVMHRPVQRVHPGDDAVAVAAEATSDGLGCLPVVEDDRLLGIVTEHDLLCAFGEHPCACQDPVERFMTREVITIQSGDTLGTARERMDSHGLRHLPVEGAGGLVGILSDRDLRREHGRGRGPEALVREAMTPDPVLADPGMPVFKAATLMASKQIDALPVTNKDGDLVGILTTVDLLDPCLASLRDEEN